MPSKGQSHRLGAMELILHPRRMYAVVAYDSSVPYLILRMVRNKRGEVFYVVPRDDREGWNPHGSRHASGQEHHKSFDQPFMQRKRQVPDKHFRGSENLTTISIYRKALTKLQHEDEFDEIFPIPFAEIVSGPPPMLAVDLAEPFVAPVITPGARITQQFHIKDRVPWIIMTLFMSPIQGSQNEQCNVYNTVFGDWS